MHQLQQFEGAIDEVALRMVEVAFIEHLPVLRDAEGAVLDHEPMGSRELIDVAKQRAVLEWHLEHEVVAYALRVGFDRRNERQQRFWLRGEKEGVAAVVEIQRFDPESIAGDQDPTTFMIKQGEGEHAPKVIDNVISPLLVATKDCLGIAFGPKR